ncbi:MAG: glycerate kinase [Desulfobacterales bacterium]|nr:glycerate kinase [Desulfobacterales bacterium]
MNNILNNIDKMRNDAIRIFYKGIEAVDPYAAVKRFCKLKKDKFMIGDKTYNLSRFKNLFVIGAGKASAPMAAAIEDLLGNKISSGIINVKYDHIVKLNYIRQFEAGHPVPDKNGLQGATSILRLSRHAGLDDLIIGLFSGGGSALLPLPAKSLSLIDKQNTIKVLLSCGASIHEINAVRKHISMIKGGQLSKAVYPATLVSLILSDVIGDDLDVIASGPTVPDSSTYHDCMEIFYKYKILNKLPESVIRYIKAGVSGKIPETPRKTDPAFKKTYNFIIGSNIDAITAAEQKSSRLGYHTIILSSMIAGDTRQAAHIHAAIAKEIIKSGHPINSPACLLSGGETTVRIHGTGLGGRNQEFALATAIDISENKNIVILSAGTDGTDGPTDAAGAIADTYTIIRASSLGLNPYDFLLNNDSYHFFQRLGDLFITGPTGTNVMDLRIILVN